MGPLGRRTVSTALAILAGLPGFAAAAENASLESSAAVHVVTFPLPAGRIYVNLPGDLAPGDAAGASVNPVPSAAAGPDGARQREELNGYAVELAGRRAPSSQALRTFTVPANASSFAVKLVDARGRDAGELKVPLRPAASLPAGYAIPAVGQAGGAVTITGSFDGDPASSAVRIGGAPAAPMAESPRQLVVRGPEEPAAPAPIEVSERGSVVATGTYRNVSVRLSAPMTNLLSGQRTTLTVNVSGLQALEQTLPLRLTNRSPDVVRMEGGEQQMLCVRPDEVKADGTWTKTRGLTGVRAGGFGITTELARPGPALETVTALDAKLRGELLARLQLDREARTASGEPVAAGAYQVAVRGAGDRGRVRLLLWRDGKEAARLDGTVVKRVSATAICDRRDVSDAHDEATAGAGEHSFGELGFTEGAAFTVQGGGRPLLVLPSSEALFSIEAPLAPPR